MICLLPESRPVYSASIGYTDRATKAAYIAAKYAPLLTSTVLDVGCDQAPLRALVGRPELYTGVDMRDTADVVLDLDREDLPFAPQSFDTVLCTDVLEHLERCHAVFDELCRVARRHVIISLPNPLAVLVRALLEGGPVKLKFYGLPAEPPPDRHRWFFGQQDAEAFLRDRARRNGFEIEQLDVEDAADFHSSDPLLNAALQHPNVRNGITWCVLRRKSST